MRLANLVSWATNRLKRKPKQGVEVLPEQSEQPSRPDSKLSDQSAQDPQKMADQLLGLLQPLWQKRHGLDLEVRFKTGQALLEGLYPSGKERLSYGGQVMNAVSQGLGISRPDLHRMVKLAREYKDLATFQAQHRDVTSWNVVKGLLAKKPAQAGSTQRKPTDPVKLAWQQVDKTVATLQATLTSMPPGTKQEDAAKRQPKFQALSKEFQKLLANETVTSDNK